MDKNNYIPWELAVRLALLGFNEPCVAEWNRSQKGLRDLLKGRNYVGYTTFIPSDRERWLDRHIAERNIFNKAHENQGNLDKACVGWNIAAPTHQQVKEWFRLKYDIDFFERPHIGRTKEYVCDPLGPNIHVKLKACATPREALEQAFWVLVETVKPIPIPELPKKKKEDEDD